MTSFVGPPPGGGDDQREPHFSAWHSRPGGRAPFVWTCTVRSYELDMYGHVGNGVYMNYLEAARIAAMSAAGLTFDRMKTEGIHVVVAAAALRYLAPAHLNNEIEVSVDVTRIGRTSVTFHQVVRNRTTSRTIVDAEVVGVFLGADGRPAAIPQDFVNAFGPPPEAA